MRRKASGGPIPTFISLIALLISIIALIYTAKTFYLKHGSDLRGFFTVASSICCEDQYVNEIAIENMKDRSLTIYKIFLLLGHSYYVQLVNFEDNPLILKPFETYSKQFDPIDFYSAGLRRIDLEKTVEVPKAKNCAINFRW